MNSDELIKLKGRRKRKLIFAKNIL